MQEERFLRRGTISRFSSKAHDHSIIHSRRIPASAHYGSRGLCAEVSIELAIKPGPALGAALDRVQFRRSGSK